MTDEERNAIVLYRMENARRTLNEIADHCERGYWNTAINRMYYACFYAASALLVANKIVVKSHEGVRQMLGKHFVLTGQLSVGMGKFYTLIFNKRSSGDYEDFINHDQKTVDELYPYALTFINSIDELLKRKSRGSPLFLHYTQVLQPVSSFRSVRMRLPASIWPE